MTNQKKQKEIEHANRSKSNHNGSAKMEQGGLKMKVKMQEIEQNIEAWTEYAIASSAWLSALTSYTETYPSLVSVVLALKLDGYEIEW
jgi:hypothetical protein